MTKYLTKYLSENEVPRNWYNLKAVMKETIPMLHPHACRVKKKTLPRSCEAVIEQELKKDKYIEIPEGIWIYRMIRPSPLIRV